MGTSITTLAAHTDSILNKMFNGLFSLKPCNDGSYFIDRNGKYFEYILEFLRTSKLNVPQDIILIDNLLSEAEYYQLKSMQKQLQLVKRSLLFCLSEYGKSSILEPDD